MADTLFVMLNQTGTKNSKTKNNLLIKGLLIDFYRHGLGELIVMHHTDSEVLVGHVVMEKGKVLLKDLGLMKNVAPKDVAVCWDIGIVGGICKQQGVEWDSLSFLGVDHCSFPVDLSSTRQNLLASNKGAFGDRLFDFNGSVYRGLQAAFESNLLPIVLMQPIKTSLNIPALAVADLRFASIPMDTLHQINELVRKSVERKLTLEFMDLDMDEDEFQNLFGSYLPG